MKKCEDNGRDEKKKRTMFHKVRSPREKCFDFFFFSRPVSVKRGVPVHHHLDVLVLRSESLNPKLLATAVGDRLAHLLELRALERLFHKVGIWVFSVFLVGVDDLRKPTSGFLSFPNREPIDSVWVVRH